MGGSVGFGRILAVALGLGSAALSNAQGPTNFTWAPHFPTPGMPVQFTDTSCCSPSAWLWIFGDQTGSQLQNPTHTYTGPGTYSVTLITNGVETAKAVTVANTASSCLDSPAVLCLNDNRFQVIADWTKPNGETGAATRVKLTSDSGYFWFFDDSNVEIVVKVLNGCALTNAYWVFAAGLTDVRVDWLVTDTQTGAQYAGVNPQGTAFAPVQATNAFPASCP